MYKYVHVYIERDDAAREWHDVLLFDMFYYQIYFRQNMY